jgi:carboxyl-terminal processing protease
MFGRWVGFLLVAMALSMTTYAVIWPRIVHATSKPQMSPIAKKYLDQSIALFREQHINAAKMDWPALTQQAYAAADGARTTADTYPAISLIIRALGEKHTFFADPDEARAMMTGKPSGDAKPSPFQLPEGTLLGKDIGVVRLFGFEGSVKQGSLYAETAQAKIRAMKARGICRFILDLRGDVGGNMYPMINGVSGLLEPGILGTFLSPHHQYQAWALQSGAVRVLPAQDTAPVAKRTSAALPVAVLIGPQTASAGEFTVMSFKGRPNTRFFGAPSAGFVTGNSAFPLSDGAVIFMTDVWGLDRTGKKYVDRIKPDEDTGSGEAALHAAVTWLSHQSCNPSRPFPS